MADPPARHTVKLMTGIDSCAAAAIGELTKQFAANLVPHSAGKTATAPFPAAAGAASTRGGRLVVCQDTPQRGNVPGMLTGSLQLGERVPYRTDQLSGLGVVGQPGHSPGRQIWSFVGHGSPCLSLSRIVDGSLGMDGHEGRRTGPHPVLLARYPLVLIARSTTCGTDRPPGAHAVGKSSTDGRPGSACRQGARATLLKPAQRPVSHQPGIGEHHPR
jgi:hypothetical protein